LKRTIGMLPQGSTGLGLLLNSPMVDRPMVVTCAFPRLGYPTATSPSASSQQRDSLKRIFHRPFATGFGGHTRWPRNRSSKGLRCCARHYRAGPPRRSRPDGPTVGRFSDLLSGRRSADGSRIGCQTRRVEASDHSCARSSL
jgi:hypothetical protein